MDPLPPPQHADQLSYDTGRQLALLAAIVEFSDDAIITKDLHSIITSWNKAAEKIFGYTAQEMIGTSITRIIPPDHLAEESEILAKIKRGEKIEHFETLRVTKGGHLLHISVTASPIKDSAGNIVGASKIARDITQQKHIEQALRQSENLFLNAFRSSPVSLTIHRWSDRTYIDVNPAFTRLTGWPREQVLGRTTDDLKMLDPNAIAKLRAHLGANRALRDEDVALTTHSGEIRHVLMSTEFVQLHGETHTITTFADVTEQKRTENALRHSEARYHTLFEYAPAGIVIADANSNYIDANAQICRMLGYTREELIGMNASHIVAPSELPHIESALNAIKSTPDYAREWLFRRKDGSQFPAEVIATAMPDGNILGIIRDISERQLLESQLRQSQKMDAVGQFAAGVAHDFNNQITIVVGYAQLAIDSLASDDPNRKLLQEIINAGERSAALTQQLLAFSRKQVLAPKILDLNHIILGAEKMLCRMIGEDIQLVTIAHPALHRVKADPGQIEQVLFNLVVNARDAMPQGGKITIETNNVELDEHYAKTHPNVLPGSYVMLAVSDSGTGMTSEIRKHIFEPFFTTKPVGKGTGLGLAVVHGIIKQSGGNIEVYSEANLGTCFKIYFPRADLQSTTGTSPLPIPIPLPGTETILLVEDESALRSLSCQILQQRGYTVFDAHNAEEALDLVTKFPSAIHLLITDVVMPGLGGRLLAEKLLTLRPNLKVLYISGYTDDAVVRHGILQEKVNFLRKPFTPSALSQKVREVLQQP